jgi:type II secretory pathway component PulF
MNIISPADLAFLNRQLASMVRLQTPLAEGFHVLAKESRGKHFQQILEGIHQNLASGKKLSQALAERPDIFPLTYVTLVEAGELSGDLSGALESMADYSETTLELRTSLFNVSIIPIMTSLVVLGVFSFIAVAVLPKFAEIFDSLGVELPLLTAIVLGFSNFMVSYTLEVLLGLLALVAFFAVSFMMRVRWLDWLLLNLPFIGMLLRTVHYTRFCMTVSHLLKHRIPLNKALELSQVAIGSPILRGAILDMKTAVENGKSLAEELRASGIFPETMAWKLAFAEKNGNLVEAFHELHRYFLQYFRMLVPRFVYIAAPCLVLIVGTGVGFIILSVFLPIFKLQAQLAGGG